MKFTTMLILIKTGVCLLNLAVAIQCFLVVSLVNSPFLNGGEARKDLSKAENVRFKIFVIVQYIYVAAALAFAIGICAVRTKAPLFAMCNHIFFLVYALNNLVYAVLAYAIKSTEAGFVLTGVVLLALLGAFLCRLYARKMELVAAAHDALAESRDQTIV